MVGEGPLAPGPMSVDGVEDQEFFVGQQGSGRFAVRGQEGLTARRRIEVGGRRSEDSTLREKHRAEGIALRGDRLEDRCASGWRQGNRRTEVGGQKSEIGARRTEVGGQRGLAARDGITK